MSECGASHHLHSSSPSEPIYNMSLAPRFRGQAFSAGIQPVACHTLELYLDYVCPFSAKMFGTLYNHVLPQVPKQYSGKVQFLFRQQIQPWHPSSTLVHEAAAAVLQIAPDKFWPFSAALFEHQKEFFDVNVVKEGRNDTYKRLAQVAAGVGVDESKIYDLLEISDKPGKDGGLNVGNKVTNDVKLMVKVKKDPAQDTQNPSLTGLGQGQ